MNRPNIPYTGDCLPGLPESAAREALSVEPGHSLSGTLTPGGVEFDAGEYLFCLGELETAFTLVYTE